MFDISGAASLHYEKDENKKAVLKQELYNNYFPEMFTRLNDIITRNNGYMAIGKVICLTYYNNHWVSLCSFLIT